ncbi:MAG: UDP-N-acetylglucosamine diphosphorylase/glucosamine-1-phosphate N-acetyltransferase [Symploca sp. SIO2G7]|nr:UDP-N-acetylglucosamine diphosphorylase/glucosamine-1-phosphate N-acetyltransferase [Symploca sp. SIO2G7]
MDHPLHIVVLAAGEGARMRSSQPKVLQPVGGQPMLGHVLRAAEALAPEQVHVVVGYAAERVRNFICTFVENGCKLRVDSVLQSQRLGTGHAVLQAMPRVPERAHVLVLPGDMPLIEAETLQQTVDRFADRKATGVSALTIISSIATDPHGYGRIVRNASGTVQSIREQADASDEEAKISEINSGVLIAGASDLNRWLGQLENRNQQQEYYLTDCVGLATAQGEMVHADICEYADQLAGANNPIQLAQLESIYRRKATHALMRGGVRMPMPESVQIRGFVSAGRDVVIDSNVILEGAIALGDRVTVGSGCVLRNCTLAAGTRVEPYCVLDGVETTGACALGPFARLRPGTVVAEDCKIGNFVETKNARFGLGAKASHLSYVGDATVGSLTNLGAGTITCNYDGSRKHHTEIGEAAFIGSNTALVAPVKIGDRATVGAGSVITRDAPAGSLTLTRGAQKNVPHWDKRGKKAKT